MRIRPSFVFLMAAIALVVGITWWHSRDTTTTPAASPSPPPGTTTAPGTPARTARPVASVPRNGFLPPSRERIRESRARQRASVQRVVAAGREKIVGRYQSEGIDASWSSATRQALMAPALTASDQIRATHSEPSDLAVDCRSTTCRITADFPTMVAADDWSTLYITGAGDQLPNASLSKSANADGSVHLEIYAIARH